MADGVEISSGSGTTILTDDTGAGGHAQVVKLAIGTDASGTLIPPGGGVEATALRVTIASDSTGVLSVDDNGASLTVDAPVATPVFVRLSDGASAITTLPVSLASVPSHAVTGPLTDTELRATAVPTSLATLPTLAAVTTVSTVTNLAQQGGVAISLNTGVRDTGTQRVTIATNDVVPVTFTGSTDVATQTTLASLLTSSQLIDDAIFADDAAFTAGSSKVMASGHQAVAHGSAPDAADALDAVIGIANRDRVPFVIGGHPNPFTYSMSITTAVTNAIIGATNSAGTKPVVTGITVVLDNASTVFPTFIIGFGTASTPAMATTPGTAQILASHPGVPAGGGMSRGDGSGILGVGVDGDEIRITTTGTAGGNGLYVTVTGYLISS